MSKDKEYNSNRSRLADRLKSEPVSTPIQEVRPVAEPPAPAASKVVIRRGGKPSKPDSKEGGGTHINFWVTAELGEALKIQAIKSKKSIKQVCVEALEAYLPKA